MTADNTHSPIGHLADVVRSNLADQQDWTQLQLHADTQGQHGRILLSGLPPRRLYVHPDEQIEILRAEKELGQGQRIPQSPEYEWVLPMHLQETPSIGQFAAVFDSIRTLPPPAEAQEAKGTLDDAAGPWKQWRGAKRNKRILLAIVQDDSTVVYYFMQDGIVKPRQN